ncbi:MAG TPA: hypothetical protein DDX71_00815 [Ruminococcus sp.]|nr:hypothetical protein [Ruminococcus sp.]
MADKSSFIIHLNTAPQWRMLSDVQAGILIKALLLYSETGEQLETDDGMLMMAFSFIKCQIDSDSEKYNARCKKNQEIADERERKKREYRDKVERERTPTNVHERERTSTNSTDNDIDNDIDNDTDNESDNDNDACAADRPQQTHARTGSSFEPPSVAEVQAYCKQRRNGIDAQRFVDYHASIGWILSGNPVRDWKAVVRKWESTQPRPAKDKPPDSSLDMAMIDRLMQPCAGGDP